MKCFFVLGAWLAAVGCMLSFSAPAMAQACINPTGAASDVVYNTTHNVAQYCNGSVWVAFGPLNPSAGATGCGNPAGAEGEIVYNSTHHVLQYCDGDNWQAAGVGPSLPGPSGCPDIGDLCADGTVFAGWHPITREHLFIPPTNQGTTVLWKTSRGSNDIATDSLTDGRANTDQVANSTTFPAFKACKDLTLGGHNDWYLPSQVELYYVWSVRPTLVAKGNITNFQSSFFLSSSEYNNDYARMVYFVDGVSLPGFKDSTSRRVRCMRR